MVQRVVAKVRVLKRHAVDEPRADFSILRVLRTQYVMCQDMAMARMQTSGCNFFLPCRAHVALSLSAASLVGAVE